MNGHTHKSGWESILADRLSALGHRNIPMAIDRTVQVAKAFTSEDWTRAGELMTASHMSLRDYFEVSCPELDLLVELALDPYWATWPFETLLLPPRHVARLPGQHYLERRQVGERDEH